MKKYQVLQVIFDVNGSDYPMFQKEYETDSIEDARHKMEILYNLFIEECVDFYDYYGCELTQEENKCLVHYVLEAPIEEWGAMYVVVESGSILLFQNNDEKSYTDFEVVEGDLKSLTEKYADYIEETKIVNGNTVEIFNEDGRVCLYKC